MSLETILSSNITTPQTAAAITALNSMINGKQNQKDMQGTHSNRPPDRSLIQDIELNAPSLYTST